MKTIPDTAFSTGEFKGYFFFGIQEAPPLHSRYIIQKTQWRLFGFHTIFKRNEQQATSDKKTQDHRRLKQLETSYSLQKKHLLRFLDFFENDPTTVLVNYEFR